LFKLYNEIDESGGQLVVSAQATQRETGFVLADLRSRMQRLPTFKVTALDDETSVSALQLRARHRGLELPTETARYLLTRRTRDMRSLYLLLDTLDREAMRAQRRLTIPFVKGVLADL
jgi:DnaA family protein